MTYGAKTKLSRKDLNIKKTHTNDAYAMGEFHPVHRTDIICYQKHRRNNRILSKFYDAKYIDIRDNTVKKGSQLSCGRTKRNIPRDSELNERIYRGQKKSTGKCTIRIQRYPIQPNDHILINGIWHVTSGMHNKGTRLLVSGKSIAANKVQKVVHAGGWIPV